MSDNKENLVLILYRPASAEHPAPVLLANAEGLSCIIKAAAELLKVHISGLATPVIAGENAMQVCYMETEDIQKMMTPKEEVEADIN